MKRRLKKWLACILTLTIILGYSTAAFAAESKERTAKITVYDGEGQYIGEFDSLSEFQQEYLGIKERSAVKWIVEIFLRALEMYDILEVNKEFTGVDINGWIDKNVTLPIAQGLGTFKLYSVSGGMTNPYPPNSYQYKQFNKTNYYWVKI